MRRQRIRLTESDLGRIVNRSVRRVLNEMNDSMYYYDQVQNKKETLRNYLETHQETSQYMEDNPNGDPYGLNKKIVGNIPPKIKRLKQEIEELEQLWWEASQREMKERGEQQRKFY